MVQSGPPDESGGRRSSRLKVGTRSLPNGRIVFEPPGPVRLAGFQPAALIATGFPVGGWKRLKPDVSAGHSAGFPYESVNLTHSR